MIIYIIKHFIYGYVSFTAFNGFAERFINICTSQGIELWNIQKSSDYFSACTSIEGYKKIRIAARKSGMKIRIKSKHGIPFIVWRNRQKQALIIGLSVIFMLLLALSNHIWIIDVNGCEGADTHQIEQVVEHSGLSIGCRISKIKTIEIKAKILADLEEYSWVSINIRGCKAVVEVRESTDMPEIEENRGTSNIIASKDGQVQIIEPYRGTAAVKPGQAVLKGDLLVSGVTESRIQTYLFSDAKGYIAAQTKINVSASAEKERTVLIPKTRKVYSIYFLGKTIPLGPSVDSDMSYIRESRMCINGIKLPFGYSYTIYTSFQEKPYVASSEETKLTALNNYALKSYHDTLHAQIISKDISVEESAEGFKVNGVYSCFENIGKRVAFEVEETPIEDIIPEENQENTQ